MQQKLILSAVISLVFAPFLAIIKKYIISDLHILVNVALLVLIDTILGIWLAYQSNKLSSTGFSKLLSKMAIYMILIIAVNQGHLNQPHTALRVLMEWLDAWVYGAIIIREMLSIFEKTALLGYFKIPDAVKKKLDVFIEGETAADEKNS